VKDADEKEAILRSLKNISVNTKEQCVAILNRFTMSSKILCFLPSNDKNVINIEVANEILNILINFSENLFYDRVNVRQFQSKLQECDCFSTFLILLNIYENVSLKVRISIILANFSMFFIISNTEKIIVDILISYLKEQSTKKLNEDENNKLMISVLNALVNITLGGDENRKILFDGGIIPLLLPLVNSSDTIVWQRTVFLLGNICFIKSVEVRNSIINFGIFDVFYKKLLEISPFPQQKIISSNYQSVIHIIIGINNLLFSNHSGVISFFKTPLIPFLLHTLDSTISIENTSSNKDIENIQLSICKCFLSCSFHCYEDTLLLVEMRVIDLLLNIIEMYINEIKRNKTLLNEETIGTISIIFSNTGNNGLNAGSEKEKNKFKNYFDENNRLNLLVNLFKYLISQTLSPILKETINYISIAICTLLKNERPPLCYGCVLQYVNKLKSSSSPIFGYDFHLAAKKAWDGMLKADECLWNSYQFREIIAVEKFEVMNGALGLDRDCYLRIVKFLHSSVVRKV
jgi:hypothetical protein